MLGERGAGSQMPTQQRLGDGLLRWPEYRQAAGQSEDFPAFPRLDPGTEELFPQDIVRAMDAGKRLAALAGVVDTGPPTASFSARLVETWLANKRGVASGIPSSHKRLMPALLDRVLQAGHGSIAAMVRDERRAAGHETLPEASPCYMLWEQAVLMAESFDLQLREPSDEARNRFIVSAAAEHLTRSIALASAVAQESSRYWAQGGKEQYAGQIHRGSYRSAQAYYLPSHSRPSAGSAPLGDYWTARSSDVKTEKAVYGAADPGAGFGPAA